VELRVTHVRVRRGAYGRGGHGFCKNHEVIARRNLEQREINKRVYSTIAI